MFYSRPLIKLISLFWILATVVLSVYARSSSRLFGTKNDGLSANSEMMLSNLSNVTSISGFIDGPEFANYQIAPSYGDNYVFFSQPDEDVLGMIAAGVTYVIYNTLPAKISLPALTDVEYTKITGASVDERSGLSLAYVDNFRGDGQSAIAISTAAHYLYMVFPHLLPRNQSFSLADINGTNGLVIEGDASFQVKTIANLGDINADGRSDIYVGGIDLTSVPPYKAGFIVLGNPIISPVVSLFNNNDVTTVYTDIDPLGLRIMRAVGLPNFNSDAYGDIAFFPYAYQSLEPELLNKGYLVYGKEGFPNTVFLNYLSSHDGFTIIAQMSSSFNGWHMAAIRFRTPEYTDLALAAEVNDFYLSQGVSQCYVVYAGNSPVSSSVFYLTPDEGVFNIIPPVDSRWSISSVNSIDFNSDGQEDLALGLHFGDPQSNFNILSSSIIVYGNIPGSSIELAGINGINGIILNDGLITTYHGNVIARVGHSGIVIGTHGFMLDPLSTTGIIYMLPDRYPSSLSYTITPAPSKTISSSNSPSLSPTGFPSPVPSSSPTPTNSLPESGPCMSLKALRQVGMTPYDSKVCFFNNPSPSPVSSPMPTKPCISLKALGQVNFDLGDNPDQICFFNSDSKERKVTPLLKDSGFFSSCREDVAINQEDITPSHRPQAAYG